MANTPAHRAASPLPAPVSGFEGITVGDYFDRWLAHIKTRVRPTTYYGYQAAIRHHLTPTLGHLRLQDLHPLHLQDLYAGCLDPPPPKRAVSASTVLHLHLVASQALQQAVRWQLLPTNPAAGAQPPRPQRREMKVATGDDLQRILQALRGDVLELPATIALTTGMRRSEILGLRWSDLSPDYTSAHIQQTLQFARGLHFERPKTHRSRRAIALPATLTQLLTRHRQQQNARRHALGDQWHDTDLVVDRGDGAPVNPNTLTSQWRRFVRTNDLPVIRFHDLRHSHATLMLLEGIHPKIVSERLGHATIGITLDTYTHLLPSMQTEAAEAIDRIFTTTAA